MLTTRRFTWNQPPGWSPILTTSNILVAPDLNGASCLFLHVILLVGLSSLHLTTIIAPRATRMAWSIPALLMMVHALLMFEPGSQNFSLTPLYGCPVGSLLVLCRVTPCVLVSSDSFHKHSVYSGAILSTFS